MIIIPTIVRNSIINASFFGILKVKIFMFVFISILVLTGLNEYLHQPIYILVIIIYVYFLMIWPIIIKIFNIESIDIGGRLVAYATPVSIEAVLVLVMLNSGSLNCLNYFKLYLFEYKIDYKLYFFFSSIFLS